MYSCLHKYEFKSACRYVGDRKTNPHSRQIEWLTLKLKTFVRCFDF